MPNPTTAPSSTTSAAATFVEGITDSLPIVIGYLPVAFAFGLSAVKLGFTRWKAFSFPALFMLVPANL